MLQFTEAKALYSSLKDKAARNTDEDLADLYKEFLQSAVEYAANRTAWSFMEPVARREDDTRRTIKHNGFIAMLSAVCRNFGVEGVTEMLSDRKLMGDFACYIALFLALEQR